MGFARSLTVRFLLVACALALVGISCPKSWADSRNISTSQFSFQQSENSQIILKRPAQCLKGLAHVTQVADSRPNLVAFVAPMGTVQLGNWVTEVMNKTETWLSNRTHMIQFCAIGMVVALIIIWWRKT